MSRSTVKASSLTLAGLIVAVSMTTIDQTIVALSAPTIQADLGLTHNAMQWAVNVYLIATAATFLLGGRLADVFGHKRMVQIGIAGFGITSLLCGLAPTGEYAGAWLITARALQGMVGAIMFPAAIGIVVSTFPREGRAKAMASFFAITGAMTAIGPIAGGYLTKWTWRSVFFVNVPLAIAASIIVAIAAPRSSRRDERIDLLGALAIAAGIAAVVFGLQQAGSWGWSSPYVVGALVAGVTLAALFVLIESKSSEPLVKLAVFRDRGFVIVTLATLFASMAFLSTFFFLSVYGQVSLGLTAINTGLLFAKFFVGFVIAAQIGSRRFDQVGARSVLVLGGLIGAIGFGWLAVSVTEIPANPGALINPQTWPIMLAGAGVGFMISAASTDAVNRAIGASYGEVTAISQTMRNFGSALGLAVFGTLVTNALIRNLTASFASLGATSADVREVVTRMSGAHTGQPPAELAHYPAAVQEQFLHTVQLGYAHAVAWAFAGAAAAMLMVTVLGLLYPKGVVSANFDEAGDAVADGSDPATVAA
jgi:EmrB/QacA subfamily drug resistance transporter